MSAREQAIQAAARHVHGSRIELAVLLGPDGQELWRGKGSRTQVAVPVGEAPRGSIVVHSHPGPSDFDQPLSLADVQLALAYELTEIVAVHVRWTHRLRLPCPRAKLSLAATGALGAWASANDMGQPTDPEQLAHVAAIVGGRYARLPSAAWLQGAGWVAPARGPAARIEALAL